MIFLSEQQLSKRYYSLPQNLRDILDSSLISEIIMKICLAHHLPKEKIESIFVLIGKVILGFIHKEDITIEIQSETGLDKRIVASIVQEIEKKIFVSIKEDLSKYYSLPSPSFSSVGLKEKLAKVDKETSDLLDILERNPLELLEEHIVDLRVQKMESENPPIAQAPAKTIEVKLPETSEAGPIILHREEEAKPVLGVKKSLGGLFKFLGKEEKKEEIKSVVAQVEIGGLILEPPATGKIEPPKVKIVHYTDFRTPLPAKEAAPIIEKPSLPEIKPAAEIPKIEEKKIEPTKIESDKKEDEEVLDLRTFTKM